MQSLGGASLHDSVTLFAGAEDEDDDENEARYGQRSILPKREGYYLPLFPGSLSLFPPVQEGVK
jgi:hypothetical protein